MIVGVLIPLVADMRAEFEKVQSMGIESVQLCGWNFDLMTPEHARSARALADEYKISISTYWCGWSGGRIWDFDNGPRTLGLLAPETREQRTNDLLQGAEYAHALGVTQMASHMGFIPETGTYDPLYGPMIDALRTVAARCKELGLKLLFETGQETPVAILRAIDDIGTGNLGVNLDPANLLMYGKANPVDALDLLGKYVYDVHAKDGEYPLDSRELGVEKALGAGRVNFPALIAKLHAVGYAGALTIEREISGEQQIEDIRAGKVFLESIVAAL